MAHVLLCTTSFPDNAFISGQEAAGSFVADFAKALSVHVKVTVVSPSLTTGSDQHGNLTLRRFQVPSLPLSLLTPTNPANWGSIVATLRAGQKLMRDVTNEHKVDHIFALWALPSGHWARVIAKEKGIPYSIWALGSDIWGLGRVPLIKSVLRRVLRDASTCFADGYLLAEDTERIGGVSCRFLPSTRKLDVTEQKVLSTGGPYKLAFLGRWHPNKGADLLLEALGILTDEEWEQIESVRYCGGGPLEDQVKSGIADLHNQNRPVERFGYLDQRAATDLYQWADYLMIPSRIESIPVIFSDAMQTDCPIITMPTGDLPRLAETYEIGVVADSIRSDAFARSIQQALRTPPNRFADGLKAAKQAFNIERSVEIFLESCNLN